MYSLKNRSRNSRRVRNSPQQDLPATVDKKFHKGLVRIPFKDLPLPQKLIKMKQRRGSGRSVSPPDQEKPEPEVVKKPDIESELESIKKKWTYRIPNAVGPGKVVDTTVSDYDNQISERDLENDDDKVKDHGDHVSQELDLDDYK